jgi:lipopolysaccharide export system permease protein
MALSWLLLYASSGWIPRSTHAAKMVLFHDLEDMFYKLLGRDREFNHPKWPFLIKVRDVQGSKMIDATFKHKVNGGKGGNEYDAIIQARTAEMHFFLKEQQVRISLEDAEIQRLVQDVDVFLINNKILPFSIPPDSKFNMEKKIQEFTNSELSAELVQSRHLLATARRKEAIKDGFAFGSGLIDRIRWGDVYQAFRDHSDLIRRCDELETEWHLRVSMAFGSLLFVLVGAPIGIRFARRDFLSAFMTCFLPIIAVYYPLMLGGVNLSKEGQLPPFASLWIGNLLLGLGALFVLPSVVKH